MDSDSDYEAFGGFSTGDILDTNSDIDDLSGSDSDSDSNADLFGSDSDDDQVVWTDVLGDVNMLPFREPVGPRHSLTEDAQAIDFFYLLIEPQFVDWVVLQTNLYAEQRQEQMQRRDTRWVPTNGDEIKAFIGMNILMGLHSLPDLDAYWSMDDRLRVDGIAKIMPKHRFKKINQYLHLADNTGAPTRGEANYDPFYKVAPIANMLSRTFHCRYKPHRELAADEAMVPFKGRHSLKQYVPSKPTKWGFKVWTLADSTNG